MALLLLRSAVIDAQNDFYCSTWSALGFALAWLACSRVSYMPLAQPAASLEATCTALVSGFRMNKHYSRLSHCDPQRVNVARASAASS